jgi:putative ABC transport system permease protein
LWAFLNQHRLDKDLDDELEAHIELATERHVGRGVPFAEARRLALVELGGIGRTKQLHRETRSLIPLETLLQDVKYAWRALIRSPRVSGTTIATLTICIGLNAAIFTVATAVLFRGFRTVAENQRILYIGTQRNGTGCCVSYPDFEDWRRRVQSMTDLGAVADLRVAFSEGAGIAESYTATLITTNTFRLLGQSPLYGRDFDAEDAAVGAPAVAIISHGFWLRRFQGDPAVLGRTVRINGTPTTIIGVMPDEFLFPQNQQLWMPLVPRPDLLRRDARNLWFAFGRLAKGATAETARAELALIGEQLAGEYPDTNGGWGPVARDFSAFFVSPSATKAYTIVWAAALLVLLIACANLANLMMARALDRVREMSVRAALGSTRWRMVRQLLLESLMLSAAGAGAGLGVATGCLWVYDRFANAPTLAWSEGLLNYSVDGSVVLYACGLAVITALLFGVAPALRVSSLDVHATLKNGGRSMSPRNRLASALIGAEVAVALVLLAASGAVVRSFAHVNDADLGITPEGRIVFNVSLPADRFSSADARLAFFEALETRVATRTGVESFAVATSLPTGSALRRRAVVEGARADDAGPPVVATLTVSPRYFPTVGASLIAGRDFDARDDGRGVPVAIVNQRFTEQFLEGDAVGRRILFKDSNTGPPITIVGVASNILQNDPNRARRQFEPAIYLPLRQTSPQSAWVIVRTDLPLSVAAEPLRREVHAVDRELPIWNGPFELTERLDGSGGYWQVGINASLLTISAAVATLLAAIGVFAGISHRVGARLQEIAIRIALGGTGRQILLLILRQTGTYVVVGLLCGIFGSFAALRLIGSYVAGVHPTDLPTLAAAALVLVVVAALACVVPARRALRVVPVDVLRSA